MARQIINTGSAINALDGDNLRIALVKTEDNFIELYDGEFQPLFPYTGSAQMTASAGQTDAVLIVTGAQDPGFAPAYSPAIEISGTENYISGSKIIWNNGVYGYISNLQQGDANDESYLELVGSAQLFLKPGNFNNTILLSNSSNNINFNHNENSSFEGFIYGQSTNYPLISFRVGSNQNRIGINKTNPTTTVDLEVNFNISASSYSALEFPNVDPQNRNWFLANSDEVFGVPGYPILCKSQGRDPLITRGLKYTISPGITVTHLTRDVSYISPTVGNQLATTIYSSSVRGGDPMPTGSVVQTVFSSPYTTPRYLQGSEVINNNNLYYTYFPGTSDTLITPTSIFKTDSNDKNTFIWWWKDDTPGANLELYHVGGGNRFNFKKGYDSAGIDNSDYMWINLGNESENRHDGGGTVISRIPYFASSFPVDIDNWHMVTLVVEGSSGAGEAWSLYITGSGGGYQTSSFTWTGWEIDQYDKFGHGDTINYSTQFTVPPGAAPKPGAGGRFYQSCYLHYTRSLDEGEIQDIFHYFSGSHGL